MITKYVTSTHKIDKTYKEIVIYAKNAKVTIEPTNDNATELVICEKKRYPYEFSVHSDTLTIKPKKERCWNLLSLGIDHSEIRISVPEATLRKVFVKSNTGHVDIRSIACDGDICIKTNTSSVNLDNIYCKAFDSTGNTGSVYLNDFTAKDSIRIKRNTGKVVLNGCYAPEISVKNNTGRVCGKLPPNIFFIASSHTGKIDVPKLPIGEIIGGRCEIKTNTGNIKFE